MTYVLSLIIYAWFCGISMIGWMSIIPFYMVVFELALGRRLKKLLYTIPYFFISAFFVLYHHRTVVNRLTEVRNFNLFNHLALNNNPFLVVTHSIFANAYEILVPNHLSIYHEPLMITTTKLVVEITMVALFIIAIIPLYKRFKPLFFGVGIFVVNLIPTFSNIGIAWLLADRYQYLGSIILACFMAWIYSKFSKYGDWVVVGIAALFLTYGYATVDRNCDYKTNHQFWLSTVKQNPMSPRAHSEMGRILIAEGNYKLAELEFKNAITCSPQYDVAWANLGVAYRYQNNYEKAVEAWEKCVTMKSHLYMPYMQVGVVYLNSDMFDKAITRFRQAYFRHANGQYLKDLQKAWHIARRLRATKKV